MTASDVPFILTTDSQWRSGVSMGLTGLFLRAPMPIVLQIVVHRGQHQGAARAHTLAPPELYLLQDVGGDADSDPLGGFPDRVPREVRIARGRLDPAVTEEAADDRQALAERQRPRGKAVSDVMDANVTEPGPRADALPRPVDVCHVPARLGSRNDPGIAGLARQGLEDADRRRRQVNRAGASFPVGEMNLGRVEIDMLPGEVYVAGIFDW